MHDAVYYKDSQNGDKSSKLDKEKEMEKVKLNKSRLRKKPKENLS